ncbi:MAG: hypothetical protein EXR76_15535, partial [Myxococcales bacterium]|nr:hypothetical protein [Myxococcales bacterium]
MRRRDAFTGAANFIDLLAGLFLVLLVAFASYLFGMKRIAAHAAQAAADLKAKGATPEEIVQSQTKTAAERLYGSLNSGPMTRRCEDGAEGQAPECLSQSVWPLRPPPPAACDAEFSPTIVHLAPGMIR